MKDQEFPIYNLETVLELCIAAFHQGELGEGSTAMYQPCDEWLIETFNNVPNIKDIVKTYFPDN